MNKEMTESSFFQCFIWSLAASGVTRINTREDKHHLLFGIVADYIKDEANHKEVEEAGLGDLLIIANPFTGRFMAFDKALLNSSKGLLSIIPPYFNEALFSVEASITASELLEEFASPKQIELLRKLAKIFVDQS